MKPSSPAGRAARPPRASLLAPAPPPPPTPRGAAPARHNHGQQAFTVGRRIPNYLEGERRPRDTSVSPPGERSAQRKPQHQPRAPAATPAPKRETGKVGVTCAGERGRGAAASHAPLEPIHDLLTPETQLRNSPIGTGTSPVGLEKEVCQRESALSRAKGRPRGKELPRGGKEESGLTRIRLFNDKRARRAAAASHDPPRAPGVPRPPRPSGGSREPPRRGAAWPGSGWVWAQEALAAPAPPSAGSGGRLSTQEARSAVRNEPCAEHFPDTRRDRQTDRRTGGRAAAGAATPARGGTSHAGGESQARRQHPGGLAEAAAGARRSPSAGEAAAGPSARRRSNRQRQRALTVMAPALRCGDVPGGQGGEPGQLRGRGAETPPRRTVPCHAEGGWKGSGRQLRRRCGGSGCPVRSR